MVESKKKLTCSKNREYTLTNTRPWISSGVERASHDPFILHHYGEFWTSLQAAIAIMVDRESLLWAGMENVYDRKALKTLELN